MPKVKPYDRTLVLPTQNLPAGAFVTQVFNTNQRNRILFRICNATAKPLDPPLGAWAYVVWRAKGDIYVAPTEVRLTALTRAPASPRGEPRALDEVERRRPERRVVEELDREAALPHEQLRRRDVHRARGLERAHGVHPPGR